MNDRDSIKELYEIVIKSVKEINLPLTDSALSYIEPYLEGNYETFYRRRLSVARTLIDLYLPVNRKKLDIILAVSLINHLPDDIIPDTHDETLMKLYAGEPKVDSVLSVLKHTDYKDKSYYDNLVKSPYALIIRLAERSVLVEKLYEWHPVDALRFVRETRESFFPMCIYAKENYPEYVGAANILHEKMRNLTAVNEALLTRFIEIENAISDEILSIREENATIRAMMKELE